ncbi:MAG TPA: ABC transporter permease [Ruminococcaceae bacterium]|nr:ABC transporter permease [Oscillospiraceae bacterium]
MHGILENLIPNVMSKPDELWQALLDTFVMVALSGIIAFFLGLFFGVILNVTKKDGILSNTAIYQVIDKLINIFRSIPFIILLTLVLPLTRAVVGTGIGVQGAIVPLIFGTVPFFSRQIESALAEVDNGVIEAAQAIGLSPGAIIFKVYLREGIASIARATTLTVINLIGLTAMAGAVGAGGLGDFAIRYGHNRFQEDITWVTVIIIVVIVTLLQVIGNWIVRKNTH